MIGGVTGTTTMAATSEEYDPATDAWYKKAGMSTARILLSAATVNNRVHAIGGTGWPVIAPSQTNEEFTPYALYVHKQN